MNSSIISSPTRAIRHDPPALFSLPAEILHLIFLYLDRINFINCATVSKAVHTLTAPYLWDDLQLRTPSQVQLFLTEAAQQALARNAELVRELLIFEDLFHVFLPVKKCSSDRATRSCTSSSSSLGCSKDHSPLADDGLYHVAVCANLRHICLAGSREAVNSWWLRNPISIEQEDAISVLFRQSLSLTSVTISCGVRPRILLRIVTEDLPNLKEFNILSIRVSAWTAQALLCNLPESTERVVMSVDCDRLGDETTDMLGAVNLTQPRNHHALKYMFINLDSTTREDIVLFPFLETCSTNLKHFASFNTRCLYNERVRSALGQLGFGMTTLDRDVLREDRLSTDKEIAATIILSSQWENIFLDSFSRAGPQTVAAILDRGEHLQFLELSGCSNLSSKDLCAILSKCRSLQRFVTIDVQDPNPTTDPGILAADLIELNWATKSLLEWSCTIEVPRSKEIQRQVYRKLAEQTELQELRLSRFPEGFMDEWQRQFYCLEMSLESGLEELAPLRELEVLDVSYMEHLISIQELEWMDHSWPNLNTLTGLYRACLNPLPGVVAWVIEHHHEWISTDEMEL